MTGKICTTISKRVLFSTIIILLTGITYSQQNLIIELGGNGVIYSLNYERFSGRKSDVSLSGGVYFMPVNFDDFLHRAIGLPISISKISLIPRNKLELGMGLTFLYGYDRASEITSNGTTYVPLGTLVFVGRIGYRFVFSNRNFLRLAFNPLLWVDRNLFDNTNNSTIHRGNPNRLRYWAGIAYGIKLNKKN